MSVIFVRKMITLRILDSDRTGDLSFSLEIRLDLDRDEKLTEKLTKS